MKVKVLPKLGLMNHWSLKIVVVFVKVPQTIKCDVNTCVNKLV
jgi:hypothetical protein